MRDFLISTASTLTLGPIQPPIQWVPGIKWLECEADNSPPSIAKVENAWNYTSIPQVHLHSVMLN
jgi:hypothetical protein